MSYRRLVASAAAIAAGVAFIPTVAFAADSSPAAPTAHGVHSVDPTKAGASTFNTFTSPAAKSVRTASGSKQSLTAGETASLAAGLTAKHTSAYGISLAVNVTGVNTTANATINWGDGSAPQSTGYLPAGQTTLAHTYAKLGAYTITVNVADQDGVTTATNTLVVTTAGSAYTAYGPTRLLDTRNGTGAPQGQIQPFTSTRVQIAGNGGIPAGVTAVVLNLTVTNAAGPGFITAYGEGDQRPITSNVNFVAGQTVPNLSIVPVGANGYVDLYNGSGKPTDLIADVAGYFTQSDSSGFTPTGPTRLVDTREGLGTARGQVAGGGSFAVQINGNGTAGLPGSGITAVALNVTVTNPKNAGFLNVYPDGQSVPTASSLNFTAGQTIANSVVVPVGSNGKIRIRNGAGLPADVIVDIVGYYSPAAKGAYLPIAPERLLDTRDPKTWSYGPLSSGSYAYMPLSYDEPAISGFVFNATVTNTATAGFLSVGPDPNSVDAYKNGTDVWPARPTASALNWVKGQTVPNLVQANTGANGIIDFWNASGGNTDLIVDMFGYYDTH